MAKYHVPSFLDKSMDKWDVINDVRTVRFARFILSMFLGGQIVTESNA
jgi:hypothetical protein